MLRTNSNHASEQPDAVPVAGWGGGAEKIVVIFQDIDTLHNLADWKSHADAEAEAAAAKAGDAGVAGSGDTADLMKNGAPHTC